MYIDTFTIQKLQQTYPCFLESTLMKKYALNLCQIFIYIFLFKKINVDLFVTIYISETLTIYCCHQNDIVTRITVIQYIFKSVYYIAKTTINSGPSLIWYIYYWILGGGNTSLFYFIIKLILGCRAFSYVIYLNKSWPDLITHSKNMGFVVWNSLIDCRAVH